MNDDKDIYLKYDFKHNKIVKSNNYKLINFKVSKNNNFYVFKNGKVNFTLVPNKNNYNLIYKSKNIGFLNLDNSNMYIIDTNTGLHDNEKLVKIRPREKINNNVSSPEIFQKPDIKKYIPSNYYYNYNNPKFDLNNFYKIRHFL